MNQKANKELVPNILEENGFYMGEIRFWNDLQRQYSSEGFTVLEFDPISESERYWRCYIRVNINEGDQKFRFWSKQKEDIYAYLNESLEKCFTDPKFRANQTFWNGLKNDLDIKGFLMPVSELRSLDKQQLRSHFTFLKLKQKYFPHILFLNNLEKEASANNKKRIPLAILAFWQHYKCYVNFLKEISKKELSAFRLIKDLFAEHFAIVGFEKQLPSEQLIEILYLSAEQFYSKDSDRSKLNKLINRSAPSVKAFFTKHEKQINSLSQKGFTQSRNPQEAERRIKEDFINVCLGDENLILIQELLDNESGNNFMQYLSPDLQHKFGEQRTRTIADKMKSVIGNASIMDRIQAVADVVQSKKKPLFAPIPHIFSTEDTQKWHVISDEAKARILEAADNSIPEYNQTELDKVVKDRWIKHLQNLANQICAPFLIWKKDQFELIPQWNFYDKEEVEKLQKAFWRKREEEEKEMEILRKMLPKLYQFRNNIALDKYLSAFPGFSFSNIQEQWDQAVNAHQITIQNRANYRIRRMKEFGIFEEHEKMSVRKEIWLDEMLQIEEEVRPYILFVKKAFQAALPVRRSVEFNPYRHSYDGLEFDPTTTQDLDKWMRGDVLKTLQKKVDRGEVEQINTFCLDASGSMDHEPMRNLFKVLYLLILGLEDRKSYDAVHFFSTFFIETVNFSNDYTNRSLLFKVLRRIATIQGDEVMYGGGGGTNISDAVAQCHTRTIDFVNEIKKKNPDANIVSSLFIITDGAPTMGVLNLQELNDLIEVKRNEGNVAIKGIYIKPKDEEGDFIPQIFGKNNYVETTEFHEAINEFVSIMTQTYKDQRKAFKWKKRREKNKRK